MNKLDEIIKEFELLTDKNTTHTYTPVYHDLFKDIRHKKLNILELGICTGGSLQLWNEYFPNSHILGMDVTYQLLKQGMNEPRIQYILRDAYSHDTINKYKSNGMKFDIIIDDGPHTKESQEICAEHYPQFLKDDGILVIEDIQSFDDVFDICDRFPKDTNKKPYIVDLRYCKGRYDDIMIIFK